MMAGGADPAVCQACGSELPPQRSRGRRRWYCNATCRSAARRERRPRSARPGPGDVMARDRRPESDGQAGQLGPADPVSLRIGHAARRLAEELGPAAGRPLGAVAAARELAAAANDAMQAAVDGARAAGHSWREIGDVLDTSRQAAFQRFGRPVDPRTGGPMIRDILPGATERAVAVFTDIAEGRWEEARTDLSEQMRAGLDAQRLASGWAMTAGTIGAFERMGEPLAYPVEHGTVVDIPLHFEAGERTGRISFDRDGQIVGLFIRPASR
jgi:Protein of unknown function (DUF3887)